MPCKINYLGEIWPFILNYRHRPVRAQWFAKILFWKKEGPSRVILHLTFQLWEQTSFRANEQQTHFVPSTHRHQLVNNLAAVNIFLWKSSVQIRRKFIQNFQQPQDIKNALMLIKPCCGVVTQQGSYKQQCTTRPHHLLYQLCSQSGQEGNTPALSRNAAKLLTSIWKGGWIPYHFIRRIGQ